MFFIKEESQSMIESRIDQYGDSFTRDLNVDELKAVGFPGANKRSDALTGERYLMG